MEKKCIRFVLGWAKSRNQLMRQFIRIENRILIGKHLQIVNRWQSEVAHGRRSVPRCKQQIQ